MTIFFPKKLSLCSFCDETQQESGQTFSCENFPFTSRILIASGLLLVDFSNRLAVKSIFCQFAYLVASLSCVGNITDTLGEVAYVTFTIKTRVAFVV